MAQANFSIYITENTIRIAELKKTGGSIQVISILAVPTPDLSFDDGMITNVENIAHAISDAIGPKKKKAKLYFTVYSRRIAAKEMNVPYMKNPALISEMINTNLNDYFPMSNLEDYITRFTILNTIEGEMGSKTLNICVYAVLKNLVTSYFELAKALKMPLISIDYQINSLYHLIQWQNRQGVSLILQIDSRVTHVSIFSGTAQIFRRSVPYGVDTIAQTIAASINTDEEKALEILLGEKDSTTPLLNDHFSSDEYWDLIQDYLSSITRVTEFFMNKNPDITIEKVKVIGSGVKIAHLSEALNKSLGLEVELISSLNSVSIRKDRKRPEITSDKLTNFLPNIGAVINPLDLRLPEDASFKKGGIGNGLFIAIAIIAALGVGGAYAFLHWQQAELNREKDALVRAIEILSYADEVHAEYIRAGEYYALLENFGFSTGNENEALLPLILTLEEIMPLGVTISQLQSNEGDINLSVSSANGRLGVARFIIELNKVPWIYNVWVSNISDDYDEDDNIISNFPVSFRISNIILELLEAQQHEAAD